MILTGEQTKQLTEALLDAFPNYGDLERMARVGLEVDLAAIAGPGDPQQAVIFRLIGWAESRGRTGDLLHAAREVNPDNSRLRDFQAAYGESAALEQTPPVPTSASRQTQPLAEQLTKVLLEVYPSSAALMEMAYFQFGEEFDQTTKGPTVSDSVYNLVAWAEEHGKTVELIDAALRINPDNPSLRELRKRAERSQASQQAKEIRPVRGSAPRLSAELRRALIDALLQTPGIENFTFRSQLLIGLSWSASLRRAPEDARADVELIVDQLSSMGQLRSGAWPLLILADNARAYAEGSEVKVRLDKVYQRLVRLYQAK